MLVSACGSELQNVPGSALRISQPELARGTDLALDIFTSPEECARYEPAEQAACLPWINRNNGEVHLSFRLLLDGEPWPLPLGREHVQVSHQGSIIQVGRNKQEYTLVPHDPQRSAQLFVLLIDGSGSMNLPRRDPRIERVRRALLGDDVLSAFFPPDAPTGVLLLSFQGDQLLPVGGSIEVIKSRREFKTVVEERLQPGSGYTNLYEAIRTATGPLLEKEPEIVRFLQTSEASPTIIALTDGFNNTSHDDVCADNAPRLGRLLKHLETVRGSDVALRKRPSVYTVGLGRPFRPRFTLPDDPEKVRAIDLCGRLHRRTPIDGNLEERGIDNASLAWIAKAGGGVSYVKQDVGGLGQAFRSAAAKRYGWFELRYRLDPFYLRRSFKTGIRLMAFATAESSVTLHPSAWLDAPPGKPTGDGWTEPSPLADSATTVMPFLGFLLVLGFLAPAIFNSRRVLLGRLKPPTPPASRNDVNTGG